jgi:hypothetical protein
LNGERSYYFGPRNVLGDLASIGSEGATEAKNIVFERGGHRFNHSEQIISVANVLLKVIVLRDFEFSSPAGSVVVSLPENATILDAQEALATRMATRGSLLRFSNSRERITDTSRLISGFRGRPLAVSYLKPVIFIYEGQEYLIPFDPTLPMREVVKLVSQAIGGGVPPQDLVICLGKSELSSDQTVAELELEDGESLCVEPRDKTQNAAPVRNVPAAAVHQPSAPAPPRPVPGPVRQAPLVLAPATATFRVGMCLGVVPQFARFTLPADATLERSRLTSKRSGISGRLKPNLHWWIQFQVQIVEFRIRRS